MCVCPFFTCWTHSDGEIAQAQRSLDAVSEADDLAVRDVHWDAVEAAADTGALGGGLTRRAALERPGQPAIAAPEARLEEGEDGGGQYRADHLVQEATDTGAGVEPRHAAVAADEGEG